MSGLRTKQLGVTLLLELLLGFSIVLIALLSVFGLFPTAERANVLADKSAQAHQLASQILETQLARDYPNITVGVFEESEPIEHTRRRGVDVTTNFRTKVEITRPYPAKAIYNIVVTVTWEEGSADEPRAAAIRLEAEKGRLW